MLQPVTLDSVVTRNEKLVTAAVGADTEMLHLDNDAYYDTNAVGSDIWSKLAAPIRVADLCGALAETYDVEPAACERDVLAFLNDALREGVIRIMAPATGE